MVIIMTKEGIMLLTMLLKICIISKRSWKSINPAQMAIKLLMNSMYDKTIIKPVETDTIVKQVKTILENMHLITIFVLIH